MIPTIKLTNKELETGLLNKDKLARARDQFDRHGVLLVDEVFSPGFIADLRNVYVDRYKSYFHNDNYHNAATVGGNRFMITVEICEPFNSALLYANPHILSIIESILTSEFILNSFGSVASLPGAEDQHLHRDTPELFEDEIVELSMPCFAVTVIIPLIEMNERNGSTKVFRGSHLVPYETGIAMDSRIPLTRVGSIILMDYRLIHGGTENCSQAVRPILYLVYSRPWFRDSANFYKQPAIEIQQDQLNRIPKQHEHLFRHMK